MPRTATVRTVEEFRTAFTEAQAAEETTTLVAKVEAVGPLGYITDLPMLENRFQFQRYLRGIQPQG